MPRKVVRVRFFLSLVLLAIAGFATVKFVSYAQKRARPATPATVIVGATEVITEPGDNDADPGNTLTFTVTATDTGTQDATGVNLTTNVPAQTTLVGGSVAISPAAGNDTYPATGNIQISVPQASGVLNNDFL